MSALDDGRIDPILADLKKLGSHPKALKEKPRRAEFQAIY